MVRIWVREEQVELSRAELGRERRLLLCDLFRQLRITRGELVELDQVASTLFELLPGLDQLAILGRFARQRACTPGIVPNARLR